MEKQCSVLKTSHQKQKHATKQQIKIYLKNPGLQIRLLVCVPWGGIERWVAVKGGSWDILCWQKSHFSCNAISQNHFLTFASLSNVLNDWTQRKRGIWSLIFHNNHLTAVEAEPTAKNPSRKTEGGRKGAFVKFGDCLNPPVTLLHGPASVSMWAPWSGAEI